MARSQASGGGRLDPFCCRLSSSAAFNCDSKQHGAPIFRRSSRSCRCVRACFRRRDSRMCKVQKQTRDHKRAGCRLSRKLCFHPLELIRCSAAADKFTHKDRGLSGGRLVLPPLTSNHTPLHPSSTHLFVSFHVSHPTSAQSPIHHPSTQYLSITLQTHPSDLVQHRGGVALKTPSGHHQGNRSVYVLQSSVPLTSTFSPFW